MCLPATPIAKSDRCHVVFVAIIVGDMVIRGIVSREREMTALSAIEKMASGNKRVRVGLHGC